MTSPSAWRSTAPTRSSKSVRNDIETQKASYRQKQEELKMSQTDIDFYQRDFTRQQALVARNNASEARFDESRHDLDCRAPALRRDASRSSRPSPPAQRRPRHSRSSSIRATSAAVARRDQAQRDLDHTMVRALDRRASSHVAVPAAGRVSGSGAGGVRAGRDRPRLDRGQPEGDRPDLCARRASRRRVTVDTYPGREMGGRGREPQPGEPGASSRCCRRRTRRGNWVKVVQRVPLRVRGRAQAGRSRRCAPA